MKTLKGFNGPGISNFRKDLSSIELKDQLSDPDSFMEVDYLMKHGIWIPDDEKLVYAIDDEANETNLFQIYDINTSELQKSFPNFCPRLEGASEGINSFSISPDGKFLVCGHADSSIQVYNLTTGKLISKMKGHQDSGSVVTVTPDSKYIISTCLANGIMVKD